MSITRVFLLASGLARLIEKERAGQRVQQGYFPEHHDRSTHVRLSGDAGHLVLASHGAEGPVEDAAEISRAQAEALLELTVGQIAYLSISLTVDSHTATVQRFLTPESLDLISMAFRARQDGPQVPAAGLVRSRGQRGSELSGSAPSPSAVHHPCRRSRSRMQPSTACSTPCMTGIEEAEPHPTRRAQAPAPSEPGFDAEAEQELDRLTIEDSVIRELARSLQPQGR